MQWKNTARHYGWASIALHWIVALAVFGLFGLGFWMVDLTYYSAWYRTAPDIHKSVGLLLFLVMLGRLAWRLSSPPPAALASHGPLTRLAARAGHGLLYLLLFGVMASGYLISTADGRPISVFGLVDVPALPALIEQQEDVAGAVHRYLAWGLVALAVVHALAALKHHFIDRDVTLLRMLGRADTTPHKE